MTHLPWSLSSGRAAGQGTRARETGSDGNSSGESRCPGPQERRLNERNLESGYAATDGGARVSRWDSVSEKSPGRRFERVWGRKARRQSRPLGDQLKAGPNAKSLLQVSETHATWNLPF